MNIKSLTRLMQVFFVISIAYMIHLHYNPVDGKAFDLSITAIILLISYIVDKIYIYHLEKDLEKAKEKV